MKTRKLPDLEEEVTSTVPTESGSAPIQGGSISSADVPVNSSVCTSVSVDDMVQTSVGTQPASSGTVGSLCFNESKAKDLEKLTNLVLTSSAFSGIRSRESVQSPVKTCQETCPVDVTEVYSSAPFNERSMKLGLRTGVAVELETDWNLDTQSRRDKYSIELRTAKPKIMIANPPCVREVTE